MRQLDDLQQATASIARVQQLFATEPQVVDAQRPVLLPNGPLSVELDAVSFAYPDDELVLREVSALVPAGATLGLLGRTGSGKTTLTRLLLRLYDPTAGSARLGGVDLRGVANADLRARVAIVTQDIQLFSATVRDNLTFFDATIADARLMEALDALGMGDWVRALPAGLDTPLASGGTGLSAGQAQLLAFARAFLHDPGLLILDEASSRLDPATERQLEQALKRLVYGRTAIIIAHPPPYARARRSHSDLGRWARARARATRRTRTRPQLALCTAPAGWHGRCAGLTRCAWAKGSTNGYARASSASHAPIFLAIRRALDRVSARAVHLQRAGYHQLLCVAAGDGAFHPADLRPAIEPHAACQRRPRDDLGAGGGAGRRDARPRRHDARLPVWRKGGHACGRYVDAAQPAPAHSGATRRKPIAAQLIAGRGRQPPAR